MRWELWVIVALLVTPAVILSWYAISVNRYVNRELERRQET
jgi:hypothetical protein